MFAVLDANENIVSLYTGVPVPDPGVTLLADDDPRIAAFQAARAAAQKPKPTPLQWLRRLTMAKQQAIFAAAASNPVLLGWLFEADGAGGGIDVTDPTTQAGVA